MPYKNVEQAQEYHRQYRATHRKELRERSLKWYREHKKERAAYQKVYRATHKKQSNVYARKACSKSHKALQDKVFDLLGYRCVRCGYNDPRALQIDHIDGGGMKERRELRNSYSLYKRILACGGVGYQRLCANCNWVKRAENGEINQWKENREAPYCARK